MKEFIWDGSILHLLGTGSREAVCVTTNGIVKSNGKAVMGAGVAKSVASTFPGIDRTLGSCIKKGGNQAYNLGWEFYKGVLFMLFSFPTKHDWRDDSDPELIRASCKQVRCLADKEMADRIYLPCPGCSNGRLDYYKDVRQILVEELDNRFTVYVPSAIAEGKDEETKSIF